MRWNGWAGKSYSAGRYWSIHLWPSVEFTWIVGNSSFHIEAKWLLWEGKINTFWRKREPIVPICSPDCTRCSGEYCEQHFDEPCDCDVEDRHAL